MSDSFYAGTDARPFQGRMQRSGSVGPNWLLIRIYLVRYLHIKKLVTFAQTAISRLSYQIVYQLHDNDADLPIINQTNENSSEIAPDRLVLNH